MLAIIFWILWILCFVGILIPSSPQRPWLPQVNQGVALILFGILGYKTLQVSL
jgi:hypothetical protein